MTQISQTGLATVHPVPSGGEQESKAKRSWFHTNSRSLFTAAFRALQAGSKSEENFTKMQTLALAHRSMALVFKSYLAIFPLWSGIPLGDLSRHTGNTTGRIKLWDSNCHVEEWFGIVKRSILLHRRKLHPAELIRRMHSPLKGGYSEHILTNALGRLKPIRATKKSIDTSQEQLSTDNSNPQKFLLPHFHRNGAGFHQTMTGADAEKLAPPRHHEIAGCHWWISWKKTPASWTLPDHFTITSIKQY